MQKSVTSYSLLTIYLSLSRVTTCRVGNMLAAFFCLLAFTACSSQPEQVINVENASARPVSNEPANIEAINSEAIDSETKVDSEVKVDSVMSDDELTREKDCIAQGGIFKPAGLLQHFTCVIPYADAGKACRDSADCEGQCLIFDMQIKPGKKIQGECQQNNLPFGCYAQVTGGIAGPFLCVD